MFFHPFNGSDGSGLSHVQQGERQSHTSMSRHQKASKVSQSVNSYSREQEEMDPELWYACAGAQHTLPPVNSLVAYFPQGHIEQVASFKNPDAEGHIPRYEHLSIIPCTLNDILLCADVDTDEVFATLTLCPVVDPDRESSYSSELPVQPKPKSVSFTKVLTVSDTSTHGGFSVPRRGAEDCFPPLDKTQDNPIQDLVAKDLHGHEWKFRHLFRGQPKRHLLTTGWSVFVSQKRLVAGDAVLFLRGEDGQLRIAVRLAPRQQKQQAIMVTTPTMAIGVLEAAQHAASEHSRFTLIYNPRSCPSQYVVPYSKYVNAMKTNFSIGQRVKSEFAMTDPKSLTSLKNISSAGQRSRPRFESEDPAEARLSGTIVDMGDDDSARWPGSVWRSIQVNWDESCSERQERVSPWEITPFSPRASPVTQDRARKRYRPPPTQLQTPQLGPSVSMMPGAQYRRPDPVPKFGTGIQDLLGYRSMTMHQGESSNLGMEVYRAYKAGCDIGTMQQAGSPSPRPSTLHPFIKSEPYGDAELQLGVCSVVEDQASTKPRDNLSSLGPLREFLPSPRPQAGSRSGTGLSDCTALSMNNLPSSDPGSSGHRAASTSAPWGNQTQSAAPSDGTRRCRIFGVSLDRPATPPESREEVATGYPNGYDGSYHDTSRGAEQSSSGISSVETGWSRRNEVEWQQKLVPEHRFPSC